MLLKSKLALLLKSKLLLWSVAAAATTAAVSVPVYRAVQQRLVPLSATCPGGSWHRFGTSEYRYCPTTITWAAAETSCGTIGAGWHLTTVNNASEDSFLALIPSGGNTKWIGATDAALEGTWLTPTGGAVPYTSWAVGEPNNGGGTEHCAELRTTSLWNDASCALNRRFVCEGPAICGNGVTGGTEACDDGNTVSGDGCSATCTIETAATCGDGRVWSTEACDDGNVTSGDGCSATCTVETGYYCTGSASQCTLICAALNRKWSGIAASNEYYYCSTNTFAYALAETLCTNVSAGWNLVTLNSAAENLHVSNTSTVTSWTGLNDRTTEGTFAWVSGSSTYTNWYPGEPNDGGGAMNQDCGQLYKNLPAYNGQWLDQNCQNTAPFICEGPAVCGNGATGGTEACDDGNTVSGDGCSSTCTIETAATCGDGRVWSTEACDDGNVASGDGCSATCTVETMYVCTGSPSVCNAACPVGNRRWTGIAGGNEYFFCTANTNYQSAETLCPSVASGYYLVTINNAAENTALSNAQTVDSWIGINDRTSEGSFAWVNGTSTYSNWVGGEPNDGGGAMNQDCGWLNFSTGGNDGYWYDQACPNGYGFICEGPPICGNGITGGSEQCDDGNTVSGDGCSSVCVLESAAVCGDGRVYSTEACDDGNTTAGDGCSATCTVEPGYTCSGAPSACTTVCTLVNQKWSGIAGGSEYYYCSLGTSYASSENLCPYVGAGYNLATINDATENAHIASSAVSQSNWIGFHDRAVEGTFAWVSGTSSFTNWNTGQPDATTAATDCARLFRSGGSNGPWYDDDCQNGYGYVCEGPARCGNGVTGGTEACDDGNIVSGDGCSSTCTLEGAPVCGDGNVYMGEACDDGNTTGGDGCSATCTVESGYICTGDPSSCSQVCTVANRKWSGVVGGNEYYYCSTGTSYSTAEALCPNVASGWNLVTVGDAAENTHIASAAVATNNWIGLNDRTSEGAYVWVSGTSSFTNWNAGEPNAPTAATDCIRLVKTGSSGPWYDDDCINNFGYICEGPPVCGNSVVGGSEGCDDGNVISGDGCSSTCTVEGMATCGDGNVYATEACDDGNTTAGDGCSATCTVEPGYVCTGDPSSCSQVCTPASRKWSGIVGGSEYYYCSSGTSFGTAEALCPNVSSGWYLATVNSSAENSHIASATVSTNNWIGYNDRTAEGTFVWVNGTSTYTNWTSGQPNAGTALQDCANFVKSGSNGLWQDDDCSGNYAYVCEGPAVCGNSVTGGSEGCDDGNVISGDGCSSTCTIEGSAVCGDGNVYATEACDDGNTTNSDGCSSTCTIEAGYTCAGDPSVCSSICAPASRRWSGITSGSEYYYCSATTNYASAETLCSNVASGWSLATIGSIAENQHIINTAAVSSWIGINDRTTEGTFVWASGAGVTYTNWANAQPDAATVAQDCGWIQRQATNGHGQWYDNDCTTNAGYVCEGPAVCGNNVRGGNENCDDGNVVSGDGCSSTCTIETTATCGDGRVYSTEGCDDGNTTAGDGCSATCTVESRYICSGQPSICALACSAGGTTWYSRVNPAVGTTEYLYCSNTQNWETAQYNCQSIGTSWDLVSIDSTGEDTFMGTISAATNKYIGYNDRTTEGTFVWSNGSSAVYTSWTGGAPNNGGGNEDCAITSAVASNWNDINCAISSAYVCEGPPICGNGVVAVPENCDDGNLTNGDGCDSTCSVELGWNCTVTANPSTCSNATHAVVDEMRRYRFGSNTYVAWRSLSENGSLGFVVSHYNAQTKEWKAVHQGMIPAAQQQAHIYQVAVNAGNDNERYRIEEVERGGGRLVVADQNLALSNAFTVQAGVHSGWQTMVAGIAGNQAGFAAQSLMSGITKANVPKTSATKALGVHIEVNNDGVYRVSAVELAQALGLPESDLRSRLQDHRLRLGDRASDTAWFFDKAADAMVFHAIASDSMYSANRIYQLRLSDKSTPTLDAIAANPAGERSSQVWTTHLAEKNKLFASVAANSADEDHWYWAAMTPGIAEFETLNDSVDLGSLPIVGDGTVSLSSMGAWGLGAGKTLNVDVSINQQRLGTCRIEALGKQRCELPVRSDWLKMGVNTFQLAVRGATTAGEAGLYVDQLNIEVLRTVQEPVKTLSFDAVGNALLAVPVDGEAAYVFDATTRERVQVSISDASNKQAEFAVIAGHHYVLATEAGLAKPTTLRMMAERNLKSHDLSATHVVIAPYAFTNAANTLAQHRTAQGIKSMVVYVEDIYDAYAYGYPTPYAIRDFLRFTFEQGRSPLKYVVLMGSGSYDYRGATAEGAGAVAAKMVLGDMGLHASDSWYADVDDDMAPNFAVGRIPAVTSIQADRVVARVINYEKNLGKTFAKEAFLLAGTPRNEDFDAYQDDVYFNWPNKDAVSRYSVVDMSTEQLRSELLKELQRGVFWFNYLGHAAQTQFDDTGVLRASDVMALSDVSRPSIVAATTCSIGRFEVPEDLSMSEALMLSEGNVSVAVWAPSGLSYAYPAAKLAAHFSSRLSAAAKPSGEKRLGDIALSFYQEAGQGAYSLKDLQTYHLFGDPALKISPDAQDMQAAADASGGKMSGGGCSVTDTHRNSQLVWMLLVIAAMVGRRWVAKRPG